MTKKHQKSGRVFTAKAIRVKSLDEIVNEKKQHLREIFQHALDDANEQCKAHPDIPIDGQGVIALIVALIVAEEEHISVEDVVAGGKAYSSQIREMGILFLGFYDELDLQIPAGFPYDLETLVNDFYTRIHNANTQ